MTRRVTWCGMVGLVVLAGLAHAGVINDVGDVDPWLANHGLTASQLVAHWPFEDGSGPTAADISGYTNDATLQNGAYFVSTSRGGVMGFDGVNDRLTVPNASSIDFEDESFTACLWFNTEQDAQSYMMAKNYGATLPFWGINIGDISASGPSVSVLGVAAIVHDGTTTSHVQIAEDYTDGEWHHATFVRDRDEANGGANPELRLYIDGDLKDSSPDISGSIGNTAELLIGDIATPGYDYQGMLDDVRLYQGAMLEHAIPEPCTMGLLGLGGLGLLARRRRGH